MTEYTVREYDEEDYKVARETMTDEKALELVESIDRGWLPDYNFTGKEDDYEHYLLHMALHRAEDALRERLKK